MSSEKITWGLAEAALSTPYLLVKTTVAEDVFEVTEDVGDTVTGVAQQAVETADIASFRLELENPLGLRKLIASAAIAVGASITPAAAGKAVTLGVAADTYNVIGHAVTAAGADGDEFYAMLTGQRPVVVA